jgi:hypothetical protein
LVRELKYDLNVESFRHIDVRFGSTAGRREVCDRGVACDFSGRKS